MKCAKIWHVWKKKQNEYKTWIVIPQGKRLLGRPKHIPEVNTNCSLEKWDIKRIN
jgi:hypothetical protein